MALALGTTNLVNKIHDAMSRKAGIMAEDELQPGMARTMRRQASSQSDAVITVEHKLGTGGELDTVIFTGRFCNAPIISKAVLLLAGVKAANIQVCEPKDDLHIYTLSLPNRHARALLDAVRKHAGKNGNRFVLKN